ncbi:lysosomal alpha-mannosidase-like isoform X1 [Ixodes scapularis]|uniref:lysosomal alpha-mannosidase-like isoform X1 n=1 Tax=Ixodes scapularis TaxID=6945 RepID=UPI001AD63BDF|nr:lysosomal alpha-mannosidase-like isoform X1 [Ixodes scapularis]
MSGCQRVIAEALRFLVWEGGVSEIRMLQCLAPGDHCPPLSVRDAWLLVYNPLSQPYRAPLRLAVHPGYEFHVDGNPTQVLDTESATEEIAFEADLPALGVRALHLVRTPRPPAQPVQHTKATAAPPENKLIVLRNKRYRLLVDSSTCLLSGLMQRSASQLTLRQSFMAYHAYQGDSARASGPRVLSPVNEEPFELGYNVTCHVVKGAQVQELRQRFSSWLVQVVRLYEDQDVIEFAWEVGPVPTDDNKGKELVSRFESSVRSGDRFYSDTNGRRSIERRRIKGSPVASDFYPVTSWAYLTSDSQDVQLTVFPDRSQAASSLSSGQLEFLVQRRLPGEPGTSIKGRHWLHVGTVQDAQESLRSLANRMVWSPQLSLVDTEQKHFVNLSVKSWSGLRAPLPRHLHVLSLERVSGDKVLLRIEYQAPETSNYTRPVNLFISRLLTKQVLYHVTETSLGSTQDRDSVLRFIWRRRGAVAPVAQQQRMRVWLKRGSRSRFEDTVRILPGHIRTFVARIERRRDVHA